MTDNKQETKRRTITRELGSWRDKSGKTGGHHSGRVFLIAEIGPDDLNPGDKMTTNHEPIAGPCRQVTYSVDFRSHLDYEISTRGEDAIETLRALATLTHPEDFDAIADAIRLLDSWHLNTTTGTCAHAPEGLHACPGLRYGCECCGNTGPVTIEGRGGVGIVTADGPAGYCEHNAVGKVVSDCGYRQWSAWLVKPLTEADEAEIIAALERITRAGVSHD